MVRIRTADELILNAIDFYKTAQPGLDTKPGTVARDLFVDGPSTQLARVYDELARIRTSQSLRLSLGSDLDKLASNYGVVRKQGSASSGKVLYTFSSIEADIPINIGDLVVAKNGASFRVVQGVTVGVTSANQYRATASKFRSDLDFVGISDEYAVEVLVEATATGILGNISKYSISTSTTAGVSNVTNASSFSGGSGAESDQAFRNRILSVYSGANAGTSLGYKNAVIADRAVLDAIVIEPGDTLMTRDGTVVYTAEDGTKTVVSEGTGGKVDIYVQGVRFVEILDSFIYRDASNKNDPTNPVNDFVLGQIAGDAGKTVTRKRIDDLENGELPNQPVNNIIQVSGSISGSNFIEKSVDELGRITGNYELIRDTGAFGGSPWGFDRLHWIDNTIRDLSEEQTKGRFNGQDALTYPDISKIGASTQNIQVVNENSTVSSTDKTSVQLAHYPVTAVTRVFNLTTGERYVVANQNPDGSGAINNTGRIIISGSTLPSTSDILQVDYTWIFDYDDAIDFDNRLTNDNPRSVIDSIDWGFSNSVTREESLIVAASNLKQVIVTHPITSVIAVNIFAQSASTVQLISGRLSCVVGTAVANVTSIKRDSDGAELFSTNKDDGSFSGLTIYLPTDTVAGVGESVTVTYNVSDIFTTSGVTGSFSDNLITLPSNISQTAGTLVEVSYIANIRTVLPQTLISSLPAIKNGNGFSTSTLSFTGIQPTTNILSGSTIIQNLRKAPTRLQLTVAGQISPGTITISGSTIYKSVNAVFTASNTGLVHNLSSQVKKLLGLSSSSSVPSNVYVARVTSVEKVQANDAFEVLSVDHVFDLTGYKLDNNSLDLDNSVQDSGLLSTEFAIPNTQSNASNQPSLGDSLRVTFYIIKTSDIENVSFSKSGSLYTQKRFVDINTIAVSSGFSSASSQTSTITINNMNQPASGSRYAVEYDYLAPKSNERISITYNKNSVITDATFAIEESRPISADVLVKAATQVVVDAHLAVVVTKQFEKSSQIVKQNVINQINILLSSSSLNTIVDQSDLIDAAYAIEGVDRVRVISFNRENEAGSVLSISAEKNQYIQPGTVLVDIEER